MATLTTTIVDQSSRSTANTTLASVPIGTAAADRVVFIYIYANGNNPGSVTIGGVSGTFTADGSGTTGEGWIKAAVPTGTTATVVLSGATSGFITYGVWITTGDSTAAVAQALYNIDGSGLTSLSTTAFAVTAGDSLIALSQAGSSSTPTMNFSAGVVSGGTRFTDTFGDFGLIGKTDYATSPSQVITASYSPAPDSFIALAGARLHGTGGGGGGDVTANPTTVAGTGAAGTPTVSGKANVTLTGNSATGSAGTPTVAVRINAAVTGVSATGAVNTPTVTGVANVTPPAATATGAVGTPAVTAVANVPITGVSATGSVGTPTTAITATASVTGVQATSAAGTPSVVGKANVPLTGVGGTGQIGDVSVEAGGSVSVPLTGVQATGAVGDVTVTAPASVSVELIGVGAIGQIGSIVVPQAGNANEVTGGGGPTYRGRHKRGKSHKQTVDEAIDRAVDKLERKSNPETERAIVAVEAVRPIANLPASQEAIDKVLRAINAVANVGRSAADMRSQVARLEATARQLEAIERQEREDEDAAIYLLLVA